MRQFLKKSIPFRILSRKKSWIQLLNSILIAVISMGFAVFMLFGCAKPPVVIGFVGPLTGSSSAVGLSSRNGFLLAFGDGPNAAPGKIGRFELVVKDDRNDTETCLEAFKELANEGCSIVVLGSTSNAAAKAIPWAMENGMFVISPTVSSVKITGNNLFVRVNTSSEEYGIKLAHTAYKKYKAYKTGIIGDKRNDNYVNAIQKAFISEYESLGGVVPFTISFDSQAEKPASALVRSLQDASCDGVVMIAASTDVVLMEKEIQRNGIKVQVFLPPWPLTLDLLQNGGSAVEGIIAVSTADLEFSMPEGIAFQAAYLDDFGEAPSYIAMFGYEAASILRASLAFERKGDPVSLRRRIITIGTFKGIQSVIKFNSSAEAEREMFLFTVKDGSFQRVE